MIAYIVGLQENCIFCQGEQHLTRGSTTYRFSYENKMLQNQKKIKPTCVLHGLRCINSMHIVNRTKTASEWARWLVGSRAISQHLLLQSAAGCRDIHLCLPIAVQLRRMGPEVSSDAQRVLDLRPIRSLPSASGKAMNQDPFPSNSKYHNSLFPSLQKHFCANVCVWRLILFTL